MEKTEAKEKCKKRPRREREEGKGNQREAGNVTGLVKPNPGS